jgi:large subunit ribosomal protein L4
MSTLKTYDRNGAAVGEFEVAESLLVTDRGEQAVHDAVVAYLAGRRAGTASTLRVGEVAGSNRKPWRQKGTGQARAGSRQSPIWRGGGVAFGPHPRSFRKHLNRKVGRLAFRRALSDRIAEGRVLVVESADLQEAKTRHFVAFLKALKVRAPALVVLGKADPKVSLAARNVRGVEVATASSVNVYQMTRYPVVVADRAAMEHLKGRLAGAAAPGKA